MEKKLLNILDRVESYREDIVETLMDLVSIESVLVDDASPYPFGVEVNRAFEFFLEKSKSLGFNTLNVDNYGGHVEMGEGSEIFAIAGHLDVVPDEDYLPEIRDGRVYGRGTVDDKGGMVASLFAMKAILDEKIELSKKVRLIVGLDEETNWKGMRHYLSKCEMPSCGFTPDASFPGVNGEKGIFRFDICLKFDKEAEEGLKIKSFKGGNAINMVPDSSRIVISSKNRDSYPDIKNTIFKIADERGYDVKIKGVGRSLEIIVLGKSAHGSMPEDGFNAISASMDILRKLDIVDSSQKDFIDFYNSKIGFSSDGSLLNLNLKDEFSSLTMNPAIIEMDEESVILGIDIRFPITYKSEDIDFILKKEVLKYSQNLGIVIRKITEPVNIPLDSDICKSLKAVYQSQTNDIDSEMKVIGMGTYSKAFKNMIAFGPAFPDDEDVIHKPGEYIDIEKLIKATKIYAEAIYRNI